jgi:hypothetical protein
VTTPRPRFAGGESADKTMSRTALTSWRAHASGAPLLMLRQDSDRGVIQAFIRKTVEAMQAARPVLIYLSQPDPERGMKFLLEHRGMAWARVGAAIGALIHRSPTVVHRARGFRMVYKST